MIESETLITLVSSRLYAPELFSGSPLFEQGFLYFFSTQFLLQGGNPVNQYLGIEKQFLPVIPKRTRKQELSLDNSRKYKNSEQEKENYSFHVTLLK